MPLFNFMILYKFIISWLIFKILNLNDLINNNRQKHLNDILTKMATKYKDYSLGYKLRTIIT